MIDMAEAGGHVKDSTAFHIPGILWDYLPVWMKGAPEVQHRGSIPLPAVDLFGYHLQITKFMVLEVVAAVLMILIFVPLAWRMSRSEQPRGKWWNLFEAILVFLRDEVARPTIGEKDADRYLPFVWSMFFFILFCNLLGMFPWAGSPTGALAVTAALAGVTLVTVVGTGMMKYGAVGYWLSLIPHMDVPWVLALFLKPMFFFVEVLGLLIRHSVLAVRLLANIFAGHLVLAVIVGFIAAAHSILVLWIGVTFASVLGATALSLLELFVAFLQAYIFVFLASLFIGMALHPH